MVVITKDLIIKKAEHHDGLLGDLEELSLHQLNIEKIEVIGTLCKKLQILYLQNNIIQKMEGLSHLHELKYLNMALNNIVRIEGLRFVAESA
jgi:protein TilB